MSIEELTAHLINSSTKDLSALTSEELKELKEFLNIKTDEIGWILKARAKAKRFANSNE